jgi:hypothetical protein
VYPKSLCFIGCYAIQPAVAANIRGTARQPNDHESSLAAKQDPSLGETIAQLEHE